MARPYKRRIDAELEKEKIEGEMLHEIAIDEIHQKENSRVDISEKELAELMISMKQSGLLEPIGVQTNEDEEEGGYEIKFGNRRLEAAKKLNWKTILCRIFPTVDQYKVMLDNLTENIQRKDISFTEQGRLFMKLEEEASMSRQEIAAYIGIPVSRVHQAISAFSTVPKIYRAKVAIRRQGAHIKKGDIPATTALKVAHVSKSMSLSKEQRAKLWEFATSDSSNGVKISTLATLMNNGHEFEDALEVAERITTSSITFAIDNQLIDSLEERLQKPYSAILRDVLRTSFLSLVGDQAGDVRFDKGVFMLTANATGNRAGSRPQGQNVLGRSIQTRLRKAKEIATTEDEKNGDEENGE